MIVILGALLGLFLLAGGHWILGGGLIVLSLAVVFAVPRGQDEI